jgi:hypothetical protein
MRLFKRFRKPKCVFCGKNTEDLREVEWFGHYSARKWIYHKDCLAKVLGTPEHYEHLMVDKAIQIAERIIESQKERAEQLDKTGQLRVQLLGVPSLE